MHGQPVQIAHSFTALFHGVDGYHVPDAHLCAGSAQFARRLTLTVGCIFLYPTPAMVASAASCVSEACTAAAVWARRSQRSQLACTLRLSSAAAGSGFVLQSSTSCCHPSGAASSVASACTVVHYGFEYRLHVARIIWSI